MLLAGVWAASNGGEFLTDGGLERHPGVGNGVLVGVNKFALERGSNNPDCGVTVLDESDRLESGRGRSK